MRNFRFLLASALLMLSLGAWAGNRYCEGITTRTSNNNVKYGDVFYWDASTNNTMHVFDLGEGTLASYSSLKFTPTNFMDFRADQSSAWSAAKMRVLFYNGDSQVGSTKEFYTIDNNEKTQDLSEFSTANRVLIAGSGPNGAKAAVIMDHNSVKLVPSEGDATVWDGTVISNNSNCKYVKNALIWNGSNANTMQLFSLSAGDLEKYESLKIKITNWTDIKAASPANKVRVLFIYGNSNKTAYVNTTGSEQTITLSSVLTEDEIASVTEIAIGGACDAGMVGIEPSDVYLVETQEVLKVEKVINSSSNATTPFEWHADGTLSSISNNLGNTEGGVIFGYANNNDANHGYFNLAGYNKVVFDIKSIADSKTIRLLAATGAGTVYTHDFYSTGLKEADDIDIQKCVSIKSGTGASTHHSLNSITFYRSFDATSTTAWDLAYDMEETTFSLPRYFNVGQSSTVCLPFALNAAQAAEAGEFYEFVAFDGSNLGFNPVTEPQAYTPYLFIPAKAYPFKNITTSLKAVNSSTLSATGGTATFKGVLQHIDNVKGAESGTVYGYDATNGEFVQVAGDGVSIDAFRAYIVISGGAALAPRLRVTIHNAPTAVENVQSENIQGTKVLRDGQLYIKYNGTMYNVQGQKVNR